MSTDNTLPEPGGTGLASHTTEAPTEGEPFLAELADDDVLLAEPADPDEPLPPRRRRSARPPRPPGPPHPGFWWAVGWCALVVFVAQIAIPLPIVIVILIVKGIQLGGVEEALKWLLDNLTKPELGLPLQTASHVGIFVIALLGIRLAAGRDWPRQVALRLPAVGHVLLALAGAPAFWLLSAGLMLLADHYLPGAGDLPSYALTAVLVMLVVGGYWLAVRLTTGKDWVRELANAPLRTQLVLGPLGVLVVVLIATQTYRLISPHIDRIPQLEGEQLSKSVEGLLSGPWWAGVLVIGLTPAFSEEFLCRVFLGRGLVGRHGFVMGIIWTSLFFGTIHLFPHQGAMAAILGLVLHSAYVAARSVLIPMLMHFLNNTLAVLAFKFLASVSPRLQVVETDPNQVPWVWFVAAAFLGAAVLWAFYTSRARLVRTDGSDEPAWQPPFAGVAHPPPGSGTEVVYPWPSVLPTLAVIAGIAGLGCALYWA